MARGRGRGGGKSELMRRVYDNHRDTSTGIGSLNPTGPLKNSSLQSSASSLQPKLFPDYANAPISELTETTYTDNDKRQLNELKILRDYWFSSPFFLRHKREETDVERYSDRYFKSDAPEGDLDPFELITHDRSMFPNELFEKVDRKKGNRKVVVLKKDTIADSVKRISGEEEKVEEGATKDDPEAPGLGEAIEEDEEEDNEEGNDYVENYFDNGEEDISDDGGDDGDGPTF